MLGELRTLLALAIAIASATGCANNRASSPLEANVANTGGDVAMPANPAPRPQPDTRSAAKQGLKPAGLPALPVEHPRAPAVGRIEKWHRNELTVFERASGSAGIRVAASSITLPVDVTEISAITYRLKIRSSGPEKWVDPADVQCCVKIRSETLPPRFAPPGGVFGTPGAG